MCGICGEWDPRGAQRERVVLMSSRLAHRGPDDEGIEVMGQVGLGARRLSIIDIEGGHQPIRNEDGTSCIVFNGEVYNYKSLRKKLIRKGHRFRTGSDTEVVLHLYEEVGKDLVHDLRGMFALAIWDARDQTLFLARDRYGQKPLFYGWDGPRFVFASELKAILATLPGLPPINLEALDDYLSVRFIPSPDTMYHGLKKLPPGHRMTLSPQDRGPSHSPSPERYWDLRFVPKHRIGEGAAVEEIRRLCKDSVGCHMVSDVPVGAFLSGGMDSSLIVALMSEIAGPSVPTFSIGVTDGDFNELGFASQVSEHCRTRHRERVVWPDLAELLPLMIYHLEEPSDPVAACMYHAAALASKGLKVVLTGDGGDEVFGGFDRYAGFPWVRYYAALPGPVRRFLLGPFLQALPDSAGYKTSVQKARWLHALSFHEGARRYAEATLFFRFGKEDRVGLYSTEIAQKLSGRDHTEAIVSGFESAMAESDLDRMLYADIVTRLPEHSLMLTDRMTMLHGLEARSPFLDHELGEFVARLPAELKVRRGRLKYALRKAAEPYLPQSILRRPKQGFMLPLGHWMKGPLVSTLQSFITRSVLVSDGLFQREAMTRILKEHGDHRVDHHARLWMLLNVELWYRMYQSGWSETSVATVMDDFFGSGHAA